MHSQKWERKAWLQDGKIKINNMRVVKIFAKEFSNRNDLESSIGKDHGLTSERKPDLIIVGTREELENLNLTDQTTFYGIGCSITDTPTLSKKTIPIDRGERYDFGINSRDKKIPE